MSYPSLILDVLVAILLVVTIGYAMALNKRLGVLRRDKAELEELAGSFVDATTRAEESISRLKHTADDLKERMEKAQSLHDDLAFLIDRGGGAADRLEEMIRAARRSAQIEAAPSAADAVPEGEGTLPRSDAERELLRAIRSAG